MRTFIDALICMCYALKGRAYMVGIMIMHGNPNLGNSTDRTPIRAFALGGLQGASLSSLTFAKSSPVDIRVRSTKRLDIIHAACYND